MARVLQKMARFVVRGIAELLVAMCSQAGSPMASRAWHTRYVKHQLLAPWRSFYMRVTVLSSQSTPVIIPYEARKSVGGGGESDEQICLEQALGPVHIFVHT